MNRVRLSLNGRYVFRVIISLFLFVSIATVWNVQRQYYSNQGTPNCTVNKRKAIPHFDEYLRHPFESSAKFPVLAHTMPDIDDPGYIQHYREINCPNVGPQIATMDSEGCIYINLNYKDHWPSFPSKEAAQIPVNNIQCKVIILEGGLRVVNSSASTVHEKQEFPLKPYVRILVNSDNFLVRCVLEKKTNDEKSLAGSDTTLLYERAFAGIQDPAREPDQIFYVDSYSDLNSYGLPKEPKIEPPVKETSEQQLSIHILVLDSTSRSQFYRHMPRSAELMNELGFKQLFGYMKVGDNSEINLASILAGDIPIALQQPRLDTVRQTINRDWILPRNMSIDADTLNFMWKEFKERGCETMLNDEIGHPGRGMFHYDKPMFKFGFTRKPTDHYYRPYYLKVLQENKNEGPVCLKGRLVHKEYMDLWRRFAVKNKRKCAFGFSFITVLPHDRPYRVEWADEDLRSMLENIYTKGAMDNSVMIIMGDHGHRVSLIREKHTGRIEERMAMMSIRFPESFRNRHPQLYQNFLENRFALTSNFEIHKTLKDIMRMNFGRNRQTIEGRGTSLFDRIPTKRSCEDAYIPINFCAAFIDRSNITEPRPRKIVNRDVQKEKALKVFKDWIGRNEDFDMLGHKLTSEMSVWGLNQYVLGGVRDILDENNTIKVENAEKNMDYLTLEFSVSTTLRLLEVIKPIEVEMLVRVDNYIISDNYLMHFEPMLTQKSVLNELCSQKFLRAYLNCVGENLKLEG